MVRALDRATPTWEQRKPIKRRVTQKIKTREIGIERIEVAELHASGHVAPSFLKPLATPRIVAVPV